jgi:hypothetical protein
LCPAVQGQSGQHSVTPSQKKKKKVIFIKGFIYPYISPGSWHGAVPTGAWYLLSQLNWIFVCRYHLPLPCVHPNPPLWTVIYIYIFISPIIP